MNRDVRKITDGAMMAAIVGVMLLINRQTAGLIETSFVWVMPLPMVFYSAKYGLKDSWIVFVSVLLLTFILGTPQTIFYVMSEMIIGVTYGSGIHDRTSGRKLVIRTMLLAVIADILSMLVFASFFGYDLTSEVNEYTDIMKQAYESMGTAIPESFDLKGMIETVVVVSVVVSGVMEGFVTHILSRLMLKRLRIYVEPMTPISDYYPAKWSGYVGIIGLVLFYYTSYNPFENDMVQRIVQGFSIACVFYLVMIGFIAVMLYLRIRFQMKGFAVVIALILSFLMSLVVAVIGFMYITTDFHERLVGGDFSNAAKGH